MVAAITTIILKGSMDVYKNNQKIVLIFLFVLLDYLAIVAAEQSAVFLRNFFFNATS